MDDALKVAARIRTRIASNQIVESKKKRSSSLSEYIKAGASVAHASGASGGGSALGLVYSSTSDTRSVQTRQSIDIDPLQARSSRLKKSVITSARLHHQECKASSLSGAWYFLTLTYAQDSVTSPRDISNLLKHMRGYFNRAKKSRPFRYSREVFRYVWVGELTLNLVPHYHVMVWVPRGMFFGKVDHRGWWPHGHSNIERARNCVGYMAKYASKFTTLLANCFPKGFRTHGVGGLDTHSKRELRFWKSPKDARDYFGMTSDIRKVQGGYVDKLSGDFWPSPWKVLLIFGRIIAWRITPCALRSCRPN